MKILIAQYQMMDLGGIVGDLEALYKGFVDLGHEVAVKQLCWKTHVQDQRSSKDGLITGTFGLQHDQTGWIWPASYRVPYKGLDNINRWKEFANKFDLVIWHMPVPSMNKENIGNSDWLELYELDGPKQVAYIHDGNFKDSYPYLYAVREKLVGLACTQGAALGSCQSINLPRALVRSGQMNIDQRKCDRFPWAGRRKGFFSCFTAKGWKHLEDLVRAVPHMQNVSTRIYAGDGIAARYMRSKDKCPGQFIVKKQYDPDIDEAFYGQKIWDVAVSHGLHWLDYLHPKDRDVHMTTTMCHIDPSWSIKYARMGSHFNRTTVEAMISGCVPVARNLGLGINESGVTDIWVPNKNYIMIPYNATPREFAGIVEYAANLPEAEYQEMLENWDVMVHDWDYMLVATRVLDLADHPEKFEVGVESYELNQKSELALSQHFGV